MIDDATGQTFSISKMNQLAQIVILPEESMLRGYPITTLAIIQETITFLIGQFLHQGQLAILLHGAIGTIHPIIAIKTGKATMPNDSFQTRLLLEEVVRKLGWHQTRRCLHKCRHTILGGKPNITVMVEGDRIDDATHDA